LVVVRLRAATGCTAVGRYSGEGGMTPRNRIFSTKCWRHSKTVVNWYGAPTQGDAPAIARAKQALAKAEASERGPSH